MLTLQNFIGGKFETYKGTKVESFNPSTGEVHAHVPDSDRETVNRAIQVAKEAFKTWKATTAEERSQVMLRIAELVEARLEEFATTESRDQGKPVWLTRSVDIPRMVHNFRFFATAILHRKYSATQMPEKGVINYTMRSPCGVAGLITPWNLPVYLLTFKIAPAIASGCCIVCKPSELTSISTSMLCEVFQQAGVPPGVINVVFGTGAVTGQAIVDNPDVKCVSFTGSTLIGKHIYAASSSHVRKLSLELGGKNAGIIFPDADMDKCISTCMRSCFINQGEVCLCTSRLFVHKDIYQQFLQRFIQTVKKDWIVGDPFDADTKMGALVSKQHLEKVKRYVQYAIEDGGTVHCGETVDALNLSGKNKNGYFMLPTIITGLKDSSRCMQEEIFGPVVCISSFETEEDVIERANGVDYGLCASLWSKDASRLHRVAPQLECGTVWCNCWLLRDLRMPFGGFKWSGLGREDQDSSLDFYTEQKTVSLQL